LQARAIIIAAGVGAFGPNRPPLQRAGGIRGQERPLPGQAARGFPRQAGGDRRRRRSAVDWTLSLADVAAKVMVVHRRDKFRAAPETVRQMKELADAGKVEMVVPYQLDGLAGANGQITSVICKTLDGATKHLEADSLLAFFGLAMNLGPIAQWGLNLDQNHITVDPATFASSAPGIFAIGDIARYPANSSSS